ncbi:MAG: hypothetical protein KDA91_11800 [Planctomycetaceae bacterium]|nr:hypothetical protein [Planctomycetaceae bacterium]
MNNEQESMPPGTINNRSMAWTVTIGFGILILIPSMLGFVMKFAELMELTKNLSKSGTEGGFAITPVVNYLLASAGFFFLLLWAAVNGMFKDLEQPKHFMLQNERELDCHD